MSADKDNMDIEQFEKEELPRIKKDANENSYAVQLELIQAFESAMERIRELEENTKWTAQTVHVAHHFPQVSLECRKSICGAARKILSKKIRSGK